MGEASATPARRAIGARRRDRPAHRPPSATPSPPTRQFGMAPIRPCVAPRRRRFRSTSGTAGQELRRPTASEFARGAPSSPGPRRKPRLRASPIIPSLVRNISPKSNSMPSAAALRSISSKHGRADAKTPPVICNRHAENSPARSAHESATRASPTTVSRSAAVEVRSRVRESRPLAAKARASSDAGSSFAAPRNRL